MASFSCPGHQELYGCLWLVIKKDLSVAVTAVTATTSSTTAPVSAPMPAARSAATAAMASAPSTGTFTLGTRFVYNERPAKKVLPIQGSDCLLRLRVIINFGEAESARLSGEPVAKQR
jgi:hypothetical protein